VLFWEQGIEVELFDFQSFDRVLDFQALSPQDINSLANYRSPQPRSTSPNHSEPPSPLPPSPTGQSVTGEDNYYMNQATIRQESDKSLQHEFEQFSMVRKAAESAGQRDTRHGMISILSSLNFCE